MLSSMAKAVAVSFEETARHFPGKETVLTGLPVRMDIAGQPRLGDIPEDSFCVFVTGGSQGAHRVNEIAAKALALLNKELSKIGKRLYVIHQTGARDAEWVTEAYAKAGIPSRVNAFEHEMGRAMSTAHVAVARAGASTCFELALTGCPAFLIPLPSAMRNHQHYNASAFVSRMAAVEGVQDELSPGSLAKWLFHKAMHVDSLSEMSDNMKSLAVPDAAGRVADLVERVAGGA